MIFGLHTGEATVVGFHMKFLCAERDAGALDLQLIQESLQFRMIPDDPDFLSP
jgi:hypothetical protein